VRFFDRAVDHQLGSVAGRGSFTQRLRSFLSFNLGLGPIRFDGADISHHQVDGKQPIDWVALRASSWWFATKSTEGTRYIDPTFAKHRRKAAEHGFTHRIFYHWLRPDSSPTVQAIHFLSVVGALAPGEGIMLDVEQRGVTAAMVLEWCHVVEAVYGRPVVIYTGAYVAGGTIWQSTAVRNSPYGRRPMHIAAYTTETRMLSLPGLKAYPQSAWQYSSDGPVAGIDGRCDMNRIDVREHYDLACGVTADPVPPIPVPTPGVIPMDVVTNANDWDAGAAGTVKFALQYAGKALYHLSPVEWVAGGSQAGIPMGNAELDALAAIPVPAVAAVDQAARDLVAEVEATVAGLRAVVAALPSGTVDSTARAAATVAQTTANAVGLRVEDLIARLRAAVVA
jgi:GH25 family lysozyme M1 (1,4-beta-N-acetylmuramidase)